MQQLLQEQSNEEELLYTEESSKFNAFIAYNQLNEQNNAIIKLVWYRMSTWWIQDGATSKKYVLHLSSVEGCTLQI